MADGNRDKKPELVPLEYERKTPWLSEPTDGESALVVPQTHRLARASIVLALISIALSVSLFCAAGFGADFGRLHSIGWLYEFAGAIAAGCSIVGMIFAIVAGVNYFSPPWVLVGVVLNLFAAGLWLLILPMVNVK
jgi:hypothetical protein